MNVNYKSGWYADETDKIRNFRWSSLNSELSFDSTLRGKNITLKIGSPENKILTIKFKTHSYDIIIKEGWWEYVVKLTDCDVTFVTSKYIVLNDDCRDLGIMLSSIELYIDSMDTIDIIDGYYTISHVASEWVDVMYLLRSPSEEKLKIESINNTYEFNIMPFDMGSVSFKIKPNDIIDGKFQFKIYTTSTLFKIKSIINRRDYYDYLGLKGSKYYDAESKVNEESCRSLSKSLPMAIQWFVSWKCNYKCEYCWEEINSHIYRKFKKNQVSCEKWADSFNKLTPDIIYFTGGEPTLYEEFCELISLLDMRIKLSITSNFGKSFDLDRWKSLIPLKRFNSIFFSLHPTQVSPSDFFSKLEKYIDHFGTYGLGLEMVLHPDNIAIISSEKLIEYCKSKNIMLNLDKFYPPSKSEIPRNFTDIEYISYGETIKKFYDCGEGTPEHAVVYCPAGWKRINVDYEGNAFTCMSAIDRSKTFGNFSMPHYNIIGNILDGNFKLRTDPILCWETNRCSACDSDFVKRTWKNFNTKNLKLPIPE